MKNSSVVVRVDFDIKLDYGVTLSVEKFTDTKGEWIASALRQLVSQRFEDDAGVDCYYDEDEGIICVGGTPGWWDCRDKDLIALLKAADIIDGANFKFSYENALIEAGHVGS